MRILVTQGGMKHSLAMIRHLGRAGHEVHTTVSDSPRSNAVGFSRYCHRVHVVSTGDRDSFIRELKEVLQRTAFDVLIPVGFPAVEYVSAEADALGKLCSFLVPPLELVRLASDKYCVSRKAIEAGVGTPRTERVTCSSDVWPAAQRVGFPLIIKGRYEYGQKIVAHVRTEAELESTFNVLCQEFGLRTADQYPVLQEYIPGWGCGFFAIYHHGNIKRLFMHRRIREYPVAKGISSCAESFFDDNLRQSGMKLLDHLQWHGVAMAEFRFDERDKTFKLIEVNPKFWGSLALALAAGADFAHDYVKLATGQDIAFNDAYARVRYQWPLDGDLLYGFAKPNELGWVLLDCLNPSVKGDFDITDPGPSIYRTWQVVRGAARKLAAQLIP